MSNFVAKNYGVILQEGFSDTSATLSYIKFN